MVRMTRVNQHDACGSVKITIEFDDRDLERVGGLSDFLAGIQVGWNQMMDRSEPDPEPDMPDARLPLCSFLDCTTTAEGEWAQHQPDRCESHQQDTFGVFVNDCDCWQSSADNADVYVCYSHRRAWEGHGEGPLPSSFKTS